MKILKEITGHPLIKVILGIFILSLTGASLVILFEGHSAQFSNIGEALWWVLVTITTVGYGDKVPITMGGRIIGILLMFSGVALLSLFTATVSSIFVARQIKEGRGLEQIKLKDHLLICGWNFNGEQILSSLEKLGKDAGTIVLVNQLTEEAVNDILSRFENLKIKFVRGDFQQEAVLNRANCKFAKSAIILPDTSSGLATRSDERTILATLSIKAINPNIKVYAHIVERENLSHIRKAKADDVLLSDAYSGYLLAAHVLSPGVPQFISQLFNQDTPFQLKRYDIGEGYSGMSYADVCHAVSDDSNAIVLGIGKERRSVNVGDLLSDDYSYLDEYIKRKFEEAGRGLSEDQQIAVKINPSKETLIEKGDFLIMLSSEKEVS